MTQPRRVTFRTDRRSWGGADAQRGDGDDLDHNPVRKARNDVHKDKDQGRGTQRDRKAGNPRFVDARSIEVNGHQPSLAVVTATSVAAATELLEGGRYEAMLDCDADNTTVNALFA
jgi:hypothetical protein